MRDATFLSCDALLVSWFHGHCIVALALGSAGSNCHRARPRTDRPQPVSLVRSLHLVFLLFVGLLFVQAADVGLLDGSLDHLQTVPIKVEGLNRTPSLSRPL